MQLHHSGLISACRDWHTLTGFFIAVASWMCCWIHVVGNAADWSFQLSTYPQFPKSAERAARVQVSHWCMHW